MVIICKLCNEFSFMPKTAIAERPYLACEQAFGWAVNWGEGKATPLSFPFAIFFPKKNREPVHRLGLINWHIFDYQDSPFSSLYSTVPFPLHHQNNFSNKEIGLLELSFLLVYFQPHIIIIIIIIISKWREHFLNKVKNNTKTWQTINFS